MDPVRDDPGSCRRGRGDGFQFVRCSGEGVVRRPEPFSFRHVIAVLLGLVGMFTLMRVDYHRYRHPATVFSLLSVVTVLLVFAYLLPATANTHRWIRLAGLSFQPAELAKLSMIIFLAYFLEIRKDRVNELRFSLIPMIAVSSLVCGLIVLQPDLGTAVSILAVAGIMLFVADLNIGWMLAAALMAAPMLYVLVLQVPWRRARLLAFRDPWSDPARQRVSDYSIADIGGNRRN